MSREGEPTRWPSAAPLLLAAFFPACEAVCEIEDGRSFDDAPSTAATSTGAVTTTAASSDAATSTAASTSASGDGGASTSTAGGEDPGASTTASGGGGSGGETSLGGGGATAGPGSGSTAGPGGGDGGHGGRGDEGGGGTGGTGGGECPNVGTATNGPYGEAALYFGTPVVDAVLPAENLPETEIGYRTGSVSPDGLLYVEVRSGVSEELRIRTRLDPFADWDDGLYHGAVWNLEPHLLAGNLGLFGGNGGLRRGSYQERASAFNVFDGIESAGEAIFDEGPFAPAEQGLDRAFTPTPDGRFVAFVSTRSEGSPEENDGVDDPRDTQLWIAEAVDEADPSLGYVSLDPIVAAWGDYTSPPTCIPAWPEEAPNWISDDGRTIVFHSGRTGRFDLYVTSGDPETGEYDAPIRIIGLSTAGKFEESFSMPSLATLATSCGRGFAYFRRFDFGAVVCTSESALYRVPVCVGSPCP